MNLASTNSPQTNKSYSYGSDGFVSRITDENNVVETQTHDPRGMPTQTIEAYGTAYARVTNTTWDPKWHEPDVIVVQDAANPANKVVTTNYNYNGLGTATSKTLTDNTGVASYPTRKWTYGKRCRLPTFRWGVGSWKLAGPAGAGLELG